MSTLIQYLKGRTARQVVASVERALRQGRLEPGDRLPTVRALARELGLSPTTVATAYRELHRRGITVGTGRAGTRIRQRPSILLRVAVDLPPGVRDLRRGQPDPDLLPASVPLRPSRRLYGDPDVSPKLEAVTRERFGAEGIDPTNLAVVGGALDGIERVLSAWLRPGARVVVEDPAYSAVLELLTALELDAVPVPMDPHGVLPEQVDAAVRDGADAIVVTPRAQNPTGSAWNPGRARALRRVLGAHPHLLVVEDDHAGPIAGVPLHTVGGATERWVTIRSVSKWLGPDLRVAMLAGDDATVARVRGRQSSGTGWVSYVLQQAVAELWSDDDGAWDRATETYSARRAHLAEELAAIGIPVPGCSGLTTWVPVDDEIGVVSGLLAAGWAVTPGERFRLATSPAVRIGHATLVPAEAAGLVGALERVLSRRATPLA